MDGELAGGKCGPVMQAIDLLDWELDEEALFDHDASTPFILLSGLKNEVDGASKVRV